MRNFQRKKDFKYYLQSKPVLILLTVILLIFIWNIFGLIGKMQETRKNRIIEQEKITDLERRKEKLTFDIEKLNTEQGKEEAIRENFGMVKIGEEVIVIVEDQEVNNEQEVNPRNNFFSFLKNIFNQ